MAIDWTSLIGPGMNLLGSAYGANQAANTATQQAQMTQFRPVGVTTRFGKSGFNYDPTTGQLIGAGYQVAPDVAAMREGLLGMAGTGLGQAQEIQAFQPQINQAAQGLFNLGQSYIAQNPAEVAQNWMAQQQALLAPGREQESAQLANKEFQRGTMGLATGATSAGYTPGGAGLAATNPRFAELANARALADATMAANAQKFGQQNVTFGSGLLTGGIDLSKGGFGLQTQALSPYTQYMQGAGNIEDAALNALKTGQSLGSAAAGNAAQAAQAYAGGQSAQSQAAMKAIQGLTDPISQLIKGLSSTSSPYNSAYDFSKESWY